MVRSTWCTIKRYSAFTSSIKTDKTSVLRYGETKASYNRGIGNYMDMLMVSGSGRREIYRVQNTQIYTYFTEKIEELGLR